MTNWWPRPRSWCPDRRGAQRKLPVVVLAALLGLALLEAAPRLLAQVAPNGPISMPPGVVPITPAVLRMPDPERLPNRAVVPVLAPSILPAPSAPSATPALAAPASPTSTASPAASPDPRWSDDPDADASNKDDTASEAGMKPRKVIRLTEPLAVMGKPIPEKRVRGITVRGVVRAVLVAPGENSGRPDDDRMLFELEVTDEMASAAWVQAGDLLYLRGWRSAAYPGPLPDPALSIVPQVDSEVVAHFDEVESGAYELLLPNGFSTWALDAPRPDPDAQHRAELTAAPTSAPTRTAAALLIPAAGASVRGKIRDVYSVERRRSSGVEDTVYTFEVTVLDPMGLPGLAAQRVIYLRGWRSVKPVAGKTAGLALVPRAFADVTARFTRARDGGLDLTLPDGFAGAQAGR